MKQLLTMAWYALLFFAPARHGYAQTDIDAIFMEKNAFCVGAGYSVSGWKNYWEGTLKRDNENLGTVTTKTTGIMGNYGVNRKLNLLFSVPYVSTKASAGQLNGQKGIQDLSIMAKYKFKEKKLGNARLSLIGVGGVSFPLSNYVADYLPLAIGSRSKMLSARIMADYYYNNKWFATASFTWVYRDNIKIDREAYYTTRLILSNQVEMPNVTTSNIRLGYRTFRLIAEAIVNNWTTHGGFDITRNNMPFPSNRMNATSVGANIKYVFPFLPQLSLNTGGSYVVAGRNMGQSYNLYGSLFYVFDFSSKKTKQ